jgi:hypothetical protein
VLRPTTSSRLRQSPPAELITAKNSAGQDESVPNPDYGVWVAKEQQVLSYLLTSLSPEMLHHVHTEKTVAGA